MKGRKKRRLAGCHSEAMGGQGRWEAKYLSEVRMTDGGKAWARRKGKTKKNIIVPSSQNSNTTNQGGGRGKEEKRCHGK